MSIRGIQTRRVLEAVAHALYATGVDPTLNDVFARVSDYFSQYPVGEPLPVPLDYVHVDKRSDVNQFNLMLANLSLNLEVLYEVCLGHVDEVLMLDLLLRSNLDRLKARRRRIETKIDDYLLSLYNTDGYYYSVSDNFSDTQLTDLQLTSAFIDTKIGCATLPTVSSMSQRLDGGLISLSSVVVTANPDTQTEVALPYTEISPFSGAVDALANTIWAIQVITDKPSEIVAVVTVNMDTVDRTVEISRLDFDPYGTTPVQIFVEAGAAQSDGVTFTEFGNKIETSTDRMSFIDNLIDVVSFRITLRKTVHDYIDQSSGTVRYCYIFGAKDIAFMQQVYDNQASYVSTPLSVEAELQSDMIIDAVSLTVDQQLPSDTSIAYYIASDPGLDNPSIGDFDWKQVEPVGSTVDTSATVIHFEGTQTSQRYIKSRPESGDLALIPLDPNNPDLTKRNPSPLFIPGVSAYRICAFDDSPVTNSMSLEEGINSTRIYYTSYNKDAVNSLDFWAARIKSTTPPNVIYGHIDTGNDFFYGGDIGESGKSVYVETYVESESDREPFLAELRKTSPASQTWSVRAYLNGREVGWLPGRNSDTQGGVLDKLTIPWTIQKGANHIALLINIPASTDTVNNPYIGTVDLLGGRDLFEFGTVKLSTWNYVSLFDMEFNQTGEPTTFTIANGEIISRRQPTTNFRLRYAKSTSKGPAAVRVRADLKRVTNNIYVSPKLSSYRLRFSYGQVENG